MNGYDVVAKILKAEGVEFLSAFPAQPLIDACAKISIRPIICHQERSGVNLADGFSRISNGRKFGVFSMQNGPGVENCFDGVVQAFANSVPILVLPGGKSLSRQGIAQTFGARRNFKHITKWAAQIYHVADIPRLMRPCGDSNVKRSSKADDAGNTRRCDDFRISGRWGGLRSSQAQRIPRLSRRCSRIDRGFAGDVLPPHRCGTGLDLETAVRSEIPILTVVLNNAKMIAYDDCMPEATKRYQSNLLGQSNKRREDRGRQ